MRRNIEGRLAKLEGTVKGGDRGKPHIIFAITEKGETLEEFEARVECQKRAAHERHPDCDLIVFELILSNYKKAEEKLILSKEKNDDQLNALREKLKALQASQAPESVDPIELTDQAMQDD